MKREEVQDQLQGIFRDIFDDASLVLFDEMTAKDVSKWDSLNHINLVVAAEQHFGVKFTIKEVSAMKNVGDFINLIFSKAA